MRRVSAAALSTASSTDLGWEGERRLLRGDRLFLIQDEGSGTVADEAKPPVQPTFSVAPRVIGGIECFEFSGAVQGSGVYGLQAARVMMPASWVLAGVLACDQPGCGPGANNTGGEGRAQVGVEGFQDLGVGKAAAISAAAEESAGTVRESEVSKFTGLVMSATTRPAAELVGALGVDFSDAGWGRPYLVAYP